MKLNCVQIEKILPPNMQSTRERILYKVLNKSYDNMAHYADKLAIYSDIDHMDEMILDHLAWQRKSDVYESDMALDVKRAVVKNTPEWHLKKGTAAAVEDVVSNVFDQSVVKEWFEAELNPNQFIIETTDNLSSTEKIEKVKTVVNKVKRFSSRLTTIVVNRDVSKVNPVGIGIYKYKKLTIGGD